MAIKRIAAGECLTGGKQMTVIEKVNTIFIFGIFLSIMVSTPSVLADVPKHYLAASFSIRNSPETKILQIGGNLDETRFLWPNMPAKKRFFSRIRITNHGDHDVISPRLSINGFRIPLSSDELIQDLSNGSQDPLDRVLRTFYAMSNYSVHALLNINRIVPLSYFLYLGSLVSGIIRE